MPDTEITTSPRPRRREASASMPNMPVEFREMRREYSADYDAGGSSRFIRNRKNLYGSADAHYSSPSKFYKAIETSRDMYRNDGVIKMLLDRAVANIFRLGFDYEPDTGDTAANEFLWQAHQDWANDPEQCDEAGVLTFAEMQPMLGLAELLDGDVLIHAPPEDSRIQVFEADQLRTPRTKTADAKLVHGVELSDHRRRAAYWVVKPGNSLSYGRSYTEDQLQRIPAYNGDNSPRCMHLFDPKRVTQTRGVIALHAVISKAGMYEDIDFTLLVKQQMAASLAWIETELKDSNAGPPGGYGANAGSETDDVGNKTVYEEIAPGSVVRPGPGKSIEMKSPNIPSSETMAHLKHTLQILSCAVGVPLCVAFLDGSETNFSGWRGALDQAKIGWMASQERWERRFHRPISRRNVGRLVRSSPLAQKFEKSLGAAIYRHNWHKPRWPYTNPLQDAEAQLAQIEGYLNDPYAIAGENGRDADLIIERTIKFNAAAIITAVKAAAMINKDYPESRVIWRDVLNRSMPKGGQIIDTAENPNTLDGGVPQQPNQPKNPKTPGA